jgi:hypothetical protein
MDSTDRKRRTNKRLKKIFEDLTQLEDGSYQLHAHQSHKKGKASDFHSVQAFFTSDRKPMIFKSLDSSMSRTINFDYEKSVPCWTT